MENKFLISEDERARILTMHENSTKNLYLNLIIEESVYNPKTEEIQKKLKSLGFNPGTIDGKYGKNTMCAVAKFQEKNRMVVDGKVGSNTANKLGVEPYFPKGVNISACGSPKDTQTPGGSPKDKQTQDGSILQDPYNGKCESIPQEYCSKISTGSEKNIGDGGSEGCAEFVTKFLELGYMGNAWAAFNTVKKYGVKYNMFTDGAINWDKIRNDVKTNGINSQTCGCFNQEGEGKDKTCTDGVKVSKTISSFYPSSSSIDLNSLKLGDIVGMYWKNSGNKGKAFCERALQRGIGNDGTFKDVDPFTFNTHVGYVGAIKNGVPIIYHSVHGKRLATPANQLLSSTGNGMITWVTGSPKSGPKQTTKSNSIIDDYLNFLKK
jgi:hypothetical protein